MGEVILLDEDCPQCGTENTLPRASFELLGTSFTCPECGEEFRWSWESSLDGDSSFFFLERDAEEP